MPSLCRLNSCKLNLPSFGLKRKYTNNIEPSHNDYDNGDDDDGDDDGNDDGDDDGDDEEEQVVVVREEKPFDWLIVVKLILGLAAIVAIVLILKELGAFIYKVYDDFTHPARLAAENAKQAKSGVIDLATDW